MTLTQKFADLRLTLHLWFFTWLAGSSAALTAMYFYLRPSDGVVLEIWHLHMAARLLEAIGLGRVEILKFGQALTTPSDFLVTFRAGMGQETVQKFGADLSLLIQTPALIAFALLAFAIVHLITSKKDNK